MVKQLWIPIDRFVVWYRLTWIALELLLGYLPSAWVLWRPSDVDQWISHLFYPWVHDASNVKLGLTAQCRFLQNVQNKMWKQKNGFLVNCLCEWMGHAWVNWCFRSNHPAEFSKVLNSERGNRANQYTHIIKIWSNGTNRGAKGLSKKRYHKRADWHPSPGCHLAPLLYKTMCKMLNRRIKCKIIFFLFSSLFCLMLLFHLRVFYSHAFTNFDPYFKYIYFIL